MLNHPSFFPSRLLGHESQFYNARLFITLFWTTLVIINGDTVQFPIAFVQASVIYTTASLAWRMGVVRCINSLLQLTSQAYRRTSGTKTLSFWNSHPDYIVSVDCVLSVLTVVDISLFAIDFSSKCFGPGSSSVRSITVCFLHAHHASSYGSYKKDTTQQAKRKNSRFRRQFGSCQASGGGFSPKASIYSQPSRWAAQHQC
jgi:hypothetical protein